MYLVVIAWMYVALMMAIAEAMHPTGTVLGAIISFFFYGVGPCALVVYLMGSPLRKRAAKAREAVATQPPAVAASEGTAPDAGGEAPAQAAVAAVRKET